MAKISDDELLKKRLEEVKQIKKRIADKNRHELKAKYTAVGEVVCKSKMQSLFLNMDKEQVKKLASISDDYDRMSELVKICRHVCNQHKKDEKKLGGNEQDTTHKNDEEKPQKRRRGFGRKNTTTSTSENGVLTDHGGKL